MIKGPTPFLNSTCNAFDSDGNLNKNDRHLLKAEKLGTSSEQIIRNRRLTIPLQTDDVTRQAPDRYRKATITRGS